MTKHLTGILAFLFLIGTLVDGGGPPTWDPQVQSQIVLTQPGVGSVYLKWPSANNNLYQMLGYQLYIGLMSDPTSGVVVLDSRGFPEVREFIQTGLTPGQQYNFSLVAWNQDPVSLNNYSSSPTTRQVNVNQLKSTDPTNLESVVAGVVASLIAGQYSRIAFQGIQPDSGLDMRVGSVCSPLDDVTCVPGRNYVASFRPICVLDSTSTECIDPRENSRVKYLMGRPTPNWLDDYPSPNQYTVPIPVYSGGLNLFDRYPGINENNLGFYTLDFAPPVAGTYSMLVESIVPGKVTVMYWENEKFAGSPANIDNQPIIDFDWQNTTIVQFTSDSVSIRVVAYLMPESDGVFHLKCTSDTFCDVWVDDVPVLETIQAGTVMCNTGCLVAQEFQFRRSQLYAIRVEYVTEIGESYLQLAWKEVGSVGDFDPIPSSVWVSRAFASNTPYTISVTSGRLSGKYSTIEVDKVNFLDGFAIVNRPVVVFIHVKDETNSPCTFSDPWASVYITVEPVLVDVSSPGNTMLIPGEYISGSNSECVYISTVIYPVPGEYQIRGYVNDEMISNSPLVTVATLDATQISAIDCVFKSISPIDPIETETSFSVQFRLLNQDGFDIPIVSPDWGAQVSGIFRRRTDFINSPNCGSRIEHNWLINCFPQSDGTYGFSYVDDSMLDVSNFPYFATISSWELSSLNGQSFLTVHSTTTAFAGNYTYSVLFNGMMVSGSPADITVVPKSTNAVDPAMSVVMLLLPDLTTTEIFEDTEIVLRVLLRDQFGNPLTDRSSESVELIFAPETPGTTTSTFACTYVFGQYYDCAGRPSVLGPNSVTVTVNGLSAPITSGGPPVEAACKTAATCGFSDCSCAQFRSPFSLNLEVIASD